MSYEWISSSLERTWRATELLLRDRDERAFDALTACPGWSVRDIVHHLVGGELVMEGFPLPAVTGERPPHVRNDRGAQNEAFVVSGRHLSGDETLQMFREVTQRRLEALRSLRPDEWEQPAPSPQGHPSLAQFYEGRIVDAWIHLQDLRDALLEPADDHGPGEEIVLNRFEAMVPYIWAQRSQAPDGALLRLNIAGRSARVVQVRVVNGRGVPSVATNDSPLVELSTAAALFWRRCAGRISDDAFLRASATDVRGDLALAQRFARALILVD